MARYSSSASASPTPSSPPSVWLMVSPPSERAVASFERGSRTRATIMATASARSPGRTAVQQLLEPQGAKGAQDGGDVAVGPGAKDLERVVHRGKRDAPLQEDAEPLDEFVGPLREVGQRALPDLAALAVGLAQKDGGRGVPVGDALDVHGHKHNAYNTSWQRYASYATWVPRTAHEAAYAVSPLTSYGLQRPRFTRKFGLACHR